MLPVALVAPWFVICVIQAELPGSQVDDVSWGFLAVLLGAMASTLINAVMAAREPLPTGRRLLVIAVGLAASLIVLVLGLVAVFYAAAVACHGAYECPL